jgi:hypothetical protein
VERLSSQRSFGKIRQRSPACLEGAKGLSRRFLEEGRVVSLADLGRGAADALAAVDQGRHDLPCSWIDRRVSRRVRPISPSPRDARTNPSDDELGLCRESRWSRVNAAHRP